MRFVPQLASRISTLVRSCLTGRAALLSLAILFAGACAPAVVPPPPVPIPVPQPPPDLSEVEIHQLAALLRLADRRDLATLELTTALAHASPHVRRRAAMVIGQIGDTRGAMLLVPGLHDRDALVRAEAAFALGEVGDSGAAVVRALIAGTLDPDTLVAGEAVAALGKIATDSARAALYQLLTSSPPRHVASQALQAVWRHRGTDQTASALAPYAASPDAELAWRAAYALMRIGGAAAAPTLLHMLQTSTALPRSLAARGLRALVTDSARLRAPAQDALVDALRDTDAQVRVNAMRTLSTYKDGRVAGLIAEHLSASDGNVAITAAESLGALGLDVAADPLLGVAADPARILPLRAAALASLLRIAPERARTVLGAWQISPQWLERYYAARSLASGKWSDVEADLRLLARDADPRIAAAALESVLAADTYLTPAAYRLYIEQLGASDAFVRAAALRGLEPRAQAADMPILLDAYELARKDRDSDAAVAAVDALGALQLKGVPVQHAFFARFSRSPDPVVRRQVATQLGTGQWGFVGPVEVAGRDSAFYVQVVRDYIAPVVGGAPELQLRIRSSSGDIVIELAGAIAPLTVKNIVDLTRSGYYASATRWHRVVPNFVLQDGDPRGDGNGGPGYAIRDEMNRIRYDRGTIGMALSGPDTGGSQFFITHSPQPHLDGGYTTFGHVISGMDIADSIVQDDAITTIEVVQ